MAADIVIGERNLERGVGSLGSRVAEEHVIEVARRKFDDARRQLKRLRVGELEGWREIELGRLPLDRLDDGLAVVAGVAAPKRGRGVEELAAFGRVIVHVL